MVKNMVWWISCINTCKAHPNNIPSSQSNMNSIKQLWHHCLMEHRITPDWTIPDGQQFRLPLLHGLASLIQDLDQSLHAHLQQGVPTGALSDMPRSFIWPPKKQDAQDAPELQLCQTNWKGADDDPQLTWSLIQEETGQWLGSRSSWRHGRSSTTLATSSSGKTERGTRPQDVNHG